MKKFWPIIPLAIVLACAEFRTEALICGYSIEGQAEQVVNITRGLPDWREWQNRLIGSWLLRWSGAILGRDTAAVYPGLLLVLRLAKNLLFGFLLFRLRADSTLCARYLVLFSYLSLLTLDVMRPYPWDHLDIMVFSLFLFGVFKRARVRYFAALFLPALLNRESALFIPLWLILDSGSFRPVLRPGLHPCRVDTRKLLTGVLLFFGGAAAVQIMRYSLLIRELGPAGNPEFAADGMVHLAWNLGFLKEAWFDFSSSSMHGLRVLYIAAIPLFFFWIRKDMDHIQRKLAAMVGCVWLSVLLFALLWETRSSSMVLPFVALIPFHHFHLRDSGVTSAGQEASATQDTPKDAMPNAS